MNIQRSHGNFTISDINIKELSILSASLDFYLSYLSDDLDRIKSGNTLFTGDYLSNFITDLENRIDNIKYIINVLDWEV